MTTSRLLAIEPLLDEIADRVAARILKAQSRMISQSASELGPRKHREAVKRRIDQGLDGAVIRGRRFLLTPEALREELMRPCKERSRAKAPPRPGLVKTDAASDRAAEVASFERGLLNGLRGVRREKARG